MYEIKCDSAGSVSQYSEEGIRAGTFGGQFGKSEFLLLKGITAIISMCKCCLNMAPNPVSMF